MLKKFSNILADPDSAKYGKKKKEYAFFAVDSFNFLQLIENWPNIVGELLAKHTSPLKIKFGTLIVLTRHSQFSGQLNFMSETLRKKIFKRYPRLRSKIKKVMFQTSPNFFSQQDKEKDIFREEKIKNVDKIHPHSPVYKAARGEAEGEFSFIEDSEMRELMIGIRIQQILQR